MELKPGFALNNKTCYICAEAHILTGLFLVYVIFQKMNLKNIVELD